MCYSSAAHKCLLSLFPQKYLFLCGGIYKKEILGSLYLLRVAGGGSEGRQGEVRQVLQAEQQLLVILSEHACHA
jgi:hypothetical protein